MANILQTKQTIDNQKRWRKLQRLPNSLLEFHKLWSTNGLNTTVIAKLHRGRSLSRSQTKFCDISEVSHICKRTLKIWKVPSLENWRAKLLILECFQVDKTVRDAETIGPEFYPPCVNAHYDYDASGITPERTTANTNEDLTV